MKPQRMVLMSIGALTLIGTGAYVFIDLYRWEWQRAMFTAVLFLAAEMATVAYVLTERMHQVRQNVEGLAQRRERISGHLRDARSAPSHVFDWLKPDVSKTSVFVPILMGAGIMLSGIAWCVERLGRATAGIAADGGTAKYLAGLGAPPNGLLDDHADDLRILRGPVGVGR